MKTFTFGKHKGKSFSSVMKKDASYLLWCRNSISIDKELEEFIDENIEKIKKRAKKEHAKFLYSKYNGETLY